MLMHGYHVSHMRIGLEKSAMQCRTCGTAIATNIKQCPSCGSPVSTGEKQFQHVPGFSARDTASPSSTPSQATGSAFIPSTNGLSPLSSPPDQPLYSETLPQRKKRQPGLLAGMFVGIVLVVLVGAAFIIIPTLVTPHTPSGNAVDPSAAAFITDITTTSSVNPLTAAPGPITQTFKLNATIYVVFHLNLKNFDFKTHSAGYIQAKFYEDKTFVYQRMLIFTQQATGSFFAVQYSQATPGNVELYWCLKSDCSDGKLAQTTSFTVVA